MEKLTIKAYAVKHKLSIFNVVQLIKRGQLPNETVKENGRDIVYILIDEPIAKKVTQATVQETSQEPYSLKKENSRLKKEIIKLQEEIAFLKNRV